MIIELEENTRLQDIEEAFSLFYPYLKLELEPLRGPEEVKKTGSVEIRSTMSIAELRHLFNGLQMFAKLFRRRTKGWKALHSDGITLKQANDAGRAEAEAVNETRYEDFFETEY